MERRTRLRKMLADMDDDQKAERFGAQRFRTLQTTLLCNAPPWVVTAPPDTVQADGPWQRGLRGVTPSQVSSPCPKSLVACPAAGTDLEYEEEPAPQNEIFYTEASPALKAARMEVRALTQPAQQRSALRSPLPCAL